MFLPQEIIRRKRDGETLTQDEIEFFIDALTHHRVSEGQAAAFAMAIFFQGMQAQECASLTRAMTASGRVLEWSSEFLGGPVLDKHSTGGIGDNVSLILAPAVAACGGFVPMISGRGLGHTGGTLDKLDSIPGYCTTPDVTRLARTVRDAGCAIIGQTDDLAPADRRLYAIRDVTATIESVPLITASILSKKLAAGLNGLVMDVKTGSGAFMRDKKDAQVLAQSLVSVAKAAGLPTHALITDMDQPLASNAGNALEVSHALAHLTGARREARMQELVCALGGEMLSLGQIAANRAEGYAMIAQALASGAAAEAFARMVHMLGGPSDLLDRPAAHLARAPVNVPVPARATGFVQQMATRDIGLIIVGLGGGRKRPEETINPSVGIAAMVEIGQHVTRGEPLAYIHAATPEAASWAAGLMVEAVVIGAEPAPKTPLILDRIVP